jgi:hypothetical protein
MSSSYTFSETYGTTGSPTTGDNNFVNLLAANVGSGGDTTTTPLANPVVLTSGTVYSYERYIRGHWTGSFSSITTLQFWKNAGTLNAGVVVNAAGKGNQTFATPVVTASGIATAPIPTSQGSGLTPAYAAAFSDYLVLQAVITVASAGAGNFYSAPGYATYRMSWNEV